MSTLQDELDYLQETKGLIKEAIINKGQDITDQDSFRSYVNKIDNIETINLQSKTVNPTTTLQTIEPDTEYNGLSQVIVSGVTSSIDSNIVRDNIKSGVTILGVTGKSSVVDTSDADAVSTDISQGKTAYVNGQKVIGSINVIKDSETSGPAISAQITLRDGESNIIGANDNSPVLTIRLLREDKFISDNSIFRTIILKNVLAQSMGLTANKIKQGETILGVTGTYTGSVMKEYASVTAMNNDIANIQEEEVVKVIENNITTFYLKETTMKKLVKEEDTISPEEYDDAIDTANNILGEEE